MIAGLEATAKSFGSWAARLPGDQGTVAATILTSGITVPRSRLAAAPSGSRRHSASQLSRSSVVMRFSNASQLSLDLIELD